MTVWLTRLAPGKDSGAIRQDMRDSVRLHKRVMSLFPDGTGSQARSRYGVLFRMEDTSAGPQLLLQSTHEPDLTVLPRGYDQAQSRPLDPLLDALRPGLTIRYRCVASPVRKPGATARAAYHLPKVVALSGAAADDWWIRQSEASGIITHKAHSHPVDAARGTRTPDDKPPQHIRHARTCFEGTATIADPERLRLKIAEGIGRGKAYGCGLLTIAPARREPS